MGGSGGGGGGAGGAGGGGESSSDGTPQQQQQQPPRLNNNSQFMQQPSWGSGARGGGGYGGGTPMVGQAAGARGPADSGVGGDRMAGGEQRGDALHVLLPLAFTQLLRPRSALPAFFFSFVLRFGI